MKHCDLPGRIRRPSGERKVPHVSYPRTFPMQVKYRYFWGPTVFWRPASMSSPSSSLRPPPRYDTVRHSQLARKGPNHNAMKGGMRGLPFRSLRFAPPMQPPPPSRISVCSDVPSIRSRDFRDFVPKSSAAPANLSSSTLYTDTLAKISELAEITRASIPMAPLEDDADSPAPVPDTDESRGDISRPVHLEDPVSHREPMPPPPPPR